MIKNTAHIIVYIQVLEEIGVWKNIRRFAGSSSGSLMAMWAALGYDSYEIEKLLDLASDKTVFGKFTVNY